MLETLEAIKASAADVPALRGARARRPLGVGDEGRAPRVDASRQVISFLPMLFRRARRILLELFPRVTVAGLQRHIRLAEKDLAREAKAVDQLRGELDAAETQAARERSAFVDALAMASRQGAINGVVFAMAAQGPQTPAALFAACDGVLLQMGQGKAFPAELDVAFRLSSLRARDDGRYERRIVVGVEGPIPTRGDTIHGAIMAVVASGPKPWPALQEVADAALAERASKLGIAPNRAAFSEIEATARTLTRSGTGSPGAVLLTYGLPVITKEAS